MIELLEPTLTGSLSPTQTATGALSGEQGVSGSITIGSFSPPEYEGPYSVTPSAQIQTLEIADHLATQNIVINPVPNNYGLITWNGSVLTVS